MTDSIAILARVRDLTHRRIRLGVFESVEKFQVTENQISLLINRAVAVESRGNFRVTKRGATLYTWDRTVLDGWIALKPITSWWFADEFYSTYPGLTPAQHAAKSRWEEMCANPGTTDWPLDSSTIARRKR